MKELARKHASKNGQKRAESYQIRADSGKNGQNQALVFQRQKPPTCVIASHAPWAGRSNLGLS
jgi:hypothetical protein